MEEAEKMAALKKAYAEIILNTAKEAASRIMASERKALCFQQEMFAAKEEALSMLIRLKQMMDSKISEAEITSLSQQRKNEELEAQLHEAEDTVIELRAELRRVEDELEKVKNNQVQPLDERTLKRDELEKVKNNQVQPLDEQTLKGDAVSQEDPSEENKWNTPESMLLPSSGPGLVTNSDVKSASFSQRNTDNKCCNVTTQTEPSSGSPEQDYYAGNTDLASIIMRNKEPELYRNGCTQRIRAFERNLLDGKLLLSEQKDDQNSHIKNESISKEEENGEETCTIASPEVEIRGVKESPTELDYLAQHDIGHENAEVVNLTPSRRKTQCRNTRATSCRSSKIGTLEDEEGGEACMIASPEADHTGMMENNPIELSEVMQHDNGCHKGQAYKRRKGLERKKLRWRTKAYLSKTHPYPVDNNVECGEDPSEITEHDSQNDPVSNLDDGLPSNTTEMPSQSGFADGIESTVVTSTECFQDATNKDVELIDDSVLTRQETDAAESSGIPVCELNLETVDVPSISSDLKDAETPETINGAPTQAVNDRLLKYTFRRKRKKESLSISDENTSLEKKNTSKRRAGEMQSGDPERQKSSLVIESSRDSRRLVQVARQLISLSAKKRWW